VALTARDGIVASADILAGSGITFNNAVTANGADQTFDAGGGKLWAKDTLSPKPPEATLPLLLRHL